MASSLVTPPVLQSERSEATSLVTPPALHSERSERSARGGWLTTELYGVFGGLVVYRAVKDAPPPFFSDTRQRIALCVFYHPHAHAA